MKRVLQFLCVTCVLALVAQPVQAQEWSVEQLEILEVVAVQWELENAGDPAWIDMLHASFQGWPIGAPNPYSKATVAGLFAIETGQSTVLMYDIAPLAIIIAGGTAVVHYYHTTLYVDHDGEREIMVGRTTDVLTLTEDGWQFVTFVGDDRSDSNR